MLTVQACCHEINERVQGELVRCPICREYVVDMVYPSVPSISSYERGINGAVGQNIPCLRGRNQSCVRISFWPSRLLFLGE